jgi:hypothetical protein
VDLAGEPSSFLFLKEGVGLVVSWCGSLLDQVRVFEGAGWCDLRLLHDGRAEKDGAYMFNPSGRKLQGETRERLLNGHSSLT